MGVAEGGEGVDEWGGLGREVRVGVGGEGGGREGEGGRCILMGWI